MVNDFLHPANRKQTQVPLRRAAQEGEAARLNVWGSGGLDRGQEYLPVLVVTANSREFSALLGIGPAGSIRLIADRILLGRKVRIGLQRPDTREFLVLTVCVLRTLRLPDGRHENGAVILKAG